MSSSDTNLHLRLELLRLRGQMQRAEAAAALEEVRGSTRRARELMGIAVRVGSLSSGGGVLATLFTTLRDRPWLLAVATFALRSARRHPLAAVLAAAAFVAVRVALRAAPPPVPPAGVEAGPLPAATALRD